jgi:hypothetical protein
MGPGVDGPKGHHGHLLNVLLSSYDGVMHRTKRVLEIILVTKSIQRGLVVVRTKLPISDVPARTLLLTRGTYRRLNESWR